jgi:signal transduction histidine kinase
MSYNRGQPVGVRSALRYCTTMQTLERLEQARALCRDTEEFGHDEFLELLGHELRTPLGAIMAASDVLDAAVPGSSDDLEARAVIARQSRQLRHVVNELLDIGRSMSSRKSGEPGSHR